MTYTLRKNICRMLFLVVSLLPTIQATAGPSDNLFALGYDAFKAGRNQEAIDLFENGLQRDSKNQLANYYLALALEQAKTAPLDRILALYQSAYAANSNNETGALAYAAMRRIERKLANANLELAKANLDMEFPPGKVFKDCTDCPPMVVIPAGGFVMGSKWDTNSMPIHRVRIKRFAIGRTEVTQGQWQAVMGYNPSKFLGCGVDCPVENVSWNDAQDFVRKLSQKTGKRYRLPSEAEWEYACVMSDQGDNEFCGSDDVGRVAWHKNNSDGTTHAVARKAGTGLGLFDMSGNVDEWVEDCFHENYKGGPVDGSAWTSGSECSWRGYRGSSWRFAFVSRYRFAREQSYRENHLGLRVAMTIE